MADTMEVQEVYWPSIAVNGCYYNLQYSQTLPDRSWVSSLRTGERDNNQRAEREKRK